MPYSVKLCRFHAAAKQPRRYSTVLEQCLYILCCDLQCVYTVISRIIAERVIWFWIPVVATVSNGSNGAAKLLRSRGMHLEKNLRNLLGVLLGSVIAVLPLELRRAAVRLAKFAAKQSAPANLSTDVQSADSPVSSEQTRVMLARSCLAMGQLTFRLCKPRSKSWMLIKQQWPLRSWRLKRSSRRHRLKPPSNQECQPGNEEAL